MSPGAKIVLGACSNMIGIVPLDGATKRYHIDRIEDTKEYQKLTDFVVTKMMRLFFMQSKFNFFPAVQTEKSY